MSTDPSTVSPLSPADPPQDPEEFEIDDSPAPGEDYDPEPTFDPDRPAAEADVIDQVIEVELDDTEDDAEPV